MKSVPRSESVEATVRIDYSMSSRVGGQEVDDENLILQLHGTIVAEGEDETELPLGKLQLYLVRVGVALDQGVSLDLVLDAYQETAELGSALFEPSFQDYLPAIRKRFTAAIPSGDLILLHRLALDPIVRGQKLGLAVLRSAIRDWSSGCSLVAIKPFPLQLEAHAKESDDWRKLALGDFPQTQKLALPRLVDYYRQLGFERLGKSCFYGLCPLERNPSSDGLHLPEFFQIPVSGV